MSNNTSEIFKNGFSFKVKKINFKSKKFQKQLAELEKKQKEIEERQRIDIQLLKNTYITI